MNWLHKDTGINKNHVIPALIVVMAVVMVPIVLAVGWFAEKIVPAVWPVAYNFFHQ